MSYAHEMNLLGIMNAPPDHVMRLLASGLGMSEIIQRCPEVSQQEIDRMMRYTSEIASAQLRTIRPIPPPSTDDDDDYEDDRPRKRRKRPRPDIQ